MSFTTTPTPQYIDEVEIDSATDSSINLSWSVKGTSHSSSHITGFQVHFQKVASSYIQYSAMLSSMTTSYKIRNLVADTFYKVCVVMYRNDTTQNGGAGGVAQQRQKCTDAGTASWHLPVSVGSSVGAIIALSLIVLMVLIARCPSIMRHRKGSAHASGKYDSMTTNLQDDHLEMSDTTLHVHEEEEDEGENDNDDEGQGEAAAAAAAFTDHRGSILVEVPVSFHERIFKQQHLQQHHHNCQSALTEGYCNGGSSSRHSRHQLRHQQSLSSPPAPRPAQHYLLHRASIPHIHHHSCQHQHHKEAEFVSASQLTDFPVPLTYISEAEPGYHIAPAVICPHQASGHSRRAHFKRQVSKGKYEGSASEQPHCSHQHSTVVKIEPQPKLSNPKPEKQPSMDLTSSL
ncbi:zinc transporter DD [Octopus vulgaris]|uniref:Zinc transporter DD n=1 Tax=Octopus vulgaris TaxID=6645 RepID=A0AA36B528_OCTVU|nr:zinc transporter DD [Octopus vulgaris]